MALSGPHQRFAEGIAAGLNATAAYIAAYPRAKPEEAAKNTSRLTKNDEITAEIARLREKIAQKFALTQVQWLNRLLRVADKAEADADYAATRSCLREIGLAMPGWYSPSGVKVESDSVIHVTIGT